MELPTILPESLQDAAQCKNDKSLYDFLVKNTDRFVIFFSYAAEDETWSLHHLPFMEYALLWFTQRYFEDRLEERYAESVVKAIQAHIAILGQILPRPIDLKVANDIFKVNSLVVAVMSPYLKNLIRRYFYEKTESLLHLPEENVSLIAYVLNYLETGDVQDLYRWEEKDIEKLLQLTEKWEIPSLSQEAQNIELRYIDRKNCVERLIFFQKRKRFIPFKACVELINREFFGMMLSCPVDNQVLLGFEFLNFQEKAFELFEKLKFCITHLILSKDLTQDPMSQIVLLQCPLLISLDISGSYEIFPYFQDIPKKVQALSIARCRWLEDNILTEIAYAASHISQLNLSQNTQLSYLGIGNLREWKGLKVLDLSGCYQLEDAEIRMIIQSHPHLEILKIAGLRKLTDQILAEIGKKMPHMQVLK